MLHTIFDWHRCQKICLARSSGEAGHERKHIWSTLLSNKPILLLNLQWVQRAQGHSPCDLLRHRSKRTRDVLSESQGMRTHFSVLYQQPAFQWNNSPKSNQSFLEPLDLSNPVDKEEMLNKWWGLTVASSREEGHPVDVDGYGTMLVMEVMDMVCGAQAGRHTGTGCSVRHRGQQGQR